MSQFIDEGPWVDRFMNRLGELVPGMEPADALNVARSVFSNLTPEEAAGVYALECSLGNCGELEPFPARTFGNWADVYVRRWTELAEGLVDPRLLRAQAYESSLIRGAEHPVKVAEDEFQGIK